MEALVGRRRERDLRGRRLGRTVEHGSGDGPFHDSPDQRHPRSGDENSAQGHWQQFDGRSANPRTLEKIAGQDGDPSEGLIPSPPPSWTTELDSQGEASAERTTGGTFEDVFTPTEGIGEGSGGHGVVGHEKAQYEGQLATMTVEEEKEVVLASNSREFAFPPWPPGLERSSVWNSQLAGENPTEEGAQEGGLLGFLRKGTKRKMDEIENTKEEEHRRRPHGEQGDKVPRGGEGKEGRRKKEAAGRRLDLPRLRVNRTSTTNGQKRKWKTAIQTARNFRVEQEQERFRDVGLQEGILHQFFEEGKGIHQEDGGEDPGEPGAEGEGTTLVVQYDGTVGHRAEGL